MVSPFLIRRALLLFALLAFVGCAPAESVFVPVQSVQPAARETSTLVPTTAITPTLLATATAPPQPTELSATAAPEASAEGQPLRGPLSVVINSPLDNAELTDPAVVLSGEADPDTVISINDAIVVTGADRKFSVPLTLEAGPNVIEITASDAAGNQGTVFMTLYVD